METTKPAWKHTNPFMTAIGFIAYHLGYYKFRIRAFFRFLLITAITAAVFYGIIALFNISVQVIRGEELWFMISR